jgi:ABC-2 type transport system ATP-binding protein
MTETVIDVRGLRMRYGARDALTGVDFAARRGEVITLLGPNGAGKSTTIEILEGFRMRSAGEVSVLGVDPARGDERWRARIGVVLQSWRDHGRWRVRDLLAHLGGYYTPYSTPERTRPHDVDELLETVGLTEQAGQRLASLSGGQRRRLDVAVGLVGRPELLFLDEPTAGFDPRSRRDFHDLVHRLSDLEDTTILLATHDLAEAEQLADRILILAEGRIVADGSADQLPGRSRARPRCAGAATASASCTPPRTPPASSASCSPSTATRWPTWRCAGPAWRTPTWPSPTGTSAPSSRR